MRLGHNYVLLRSQGSTLKLSLLCTFRVSQLTCILLYEHLVSVFGRCSPNVFGCGSRVGRKQRVSSLKQLLSLLLPAGEGRCIRIGDNAELDLLDSLELNKCQIQNIIQ